MGGTHPIRSKVAMTGDNMLRWGWRTLPNASETNQLKHLTTLFALAKRDRGVPKKTYGMRTPRLVVGARDEAMERKAIND